MDVLGRWHATMREGLQHAIRDVLGRRHAMIREGHQHAIREGRWHARCFRRLCGLALHLGRLRRAIDGVGDGDGDPVLLREEARPEGIGRRVLPP